MKKLKSEVISAWDAGGHILKTIAQGVVDAGAPVEILGTAPTDPELIKRVGEQFVISTFKWASELRCSPKTVSTDRMFKDLRNDITRVANVMIPQEMALNHSVDFEFCWTPFGLGAHQQIRLIRQLSRRIASPQLLIMCLPEINEYLRSRGWSRPSSMALYTAVNAHSHNLPPLKLTFPAGRKGGALLAAWDPSKHQKPDTKDHVEIVLIERDC